ncbi:MAG: hypothetical protein A2172_03755 [Candidatus Woykebacteria bacterium RBG_13_40_15]|uniref:Uncharacterized protein n=1 Tax=Candidatus Woykebacteria bacterium RBG_13_40_15 TaxID=1802593 RepID=A0A1G1W6L5_9BACT|nr:MAG: hypothetical protein A2172_03755 [Candidatus Woykebacteria bacterium RBG_13_40_15]
MEYKDYCQTCGKELIEGLNIKKEWHIPLCVNCREIVMSYQIKKEQIDKIMRARAIKLND